MEQHPPKEIAVTPEMLAIMQSLADRINHARHQAAAAMAAHHASTEQLEQYIRQCAQLLGLPEDTAFDKPRGVFVIELHVRMNVAIPAGGP